jgi:hypothetical protein
VIYFKNKLPDSNSPRHPLLQLVPVLSAAVVTVLGLLMTASALGWVKFAD